MQNAFEGMHEHSHQSAEIDFPDARRPKLMSGQAFLGITTYIHMCMWLLTWTDCEQPLVLAELVVLAACRDQPGAAAFSRTDLRSYLHWRKLLYTCHLLPRMQSCLLARHNLLAFLDWHHFNHRNCIEPYATAVLVEPGEATTFSRTSNSQQQQQ